MQAAVAHIPHAAASPIGALAQLLDDLSSVVANLSSEAYCAPFEGGVSGTIGEHVRHCLDHVAGSRRGSDAGAVLRSPAARHAHRDVP